MPGDGPLPDAKVRKVWNYNLDILVAFSDNSATFRELFKPVQGDCGSPLLRYLEWSPTLARNRRAAVEEEC